MSISSSSSSLFPSSPALRAAPTPKTLPPELTSRILHSLIALHLSDTILSSLSTRDAAHHTRQVLAPLLKIGRTWYEEVRRLLWRDVDLFILVYKGKGAGGLGGCGRVVRCLEVVAAPGKRQRQGAKVNGGGSDSDADNADSSSCYDARTSTTSEFSLHDPTSWSGVGAYTRQLELFFPMPPERAIPTVDGMSAYRYSGPLWTRGVIRLLERALRRFTRIEELTLRDFPAFLIPSIPVTHLHTLRFYAPFTHSLAHFSFASSLHTLVITPSFLEFLQSTLKATVPPDPFFDPSLLPASVARLHTTSNPIPGFMIRTPVKFWALTHPFLPSVMASFEEGSRDRMKSFELSTDFGHSDTSRELGEAMVRLGLAPTEVLFTGNVFDLTPCVRGLGVQDPIFESANADYPWRLGGADAGKDMKESLKAVGENFEHVAVSIRPFAPMEDIEQFVFSLTRLPHLRTFTFKRHYCDPHYPYLRYKQQVELQHITLFSGCKKLETIRFEGVPGAPGEGKWEVGRNFRGANADADANALTGEDAGVQTYMEQSAAPAN